MEVRFPSSDAVVVTMLLLLLLPLLSAHARAVSSLPSEPAWQKGMYELKQLPRVDEAYLKVEIA